MKQSTQVLQTSSKKTRGMVQTGLFSALIIIMAFTPFLGYIPLGFTRATIIHIPVIIGSILLGPVQGAICGSVFGLTSLINNTMNPTVTSFVFSPFYSLGKFSGGFGSLVICFVPRILVGVVPYYVYRGMKKMHVGNNVSLAVAGVCGSMTNTLLVMNLIYLFFKNEYAAAQQMDAGKLYDVILAVIGTNGVPEAIVAGIIVTVVTKVLLKSSSVQNSL